MGIVKRLSFLLFVLLPMTLLANQYTFDQDHTFVIWRVNHFDYSEVTGKIFANGTLTFDEAKPQNSQLNLQVDMNTLSTGVEKLDRKLASRSFFDIQTYPTATFVSKTVKKTGKLTATVEGVVTIKTIAKPLTLNVTLKKHGNHPFLHRPALGFVATTQLKRSDFGLRAYLPGVGDEITVEIQAEAIQNKKPSAGE